MTTLKPALKPMSLFCACALACGPLAAQPKVDAPPIRVVLRGFAKMPQYTNFLEVLVEACLQIQKLPQGSVKLPPAQVLASTPVQEVEQLFDGYWSATFATNSGLHPDPKAGCQVKLLKTYSAAVERSCSLRMWGGTQGQRSDIAVGEAPITESFSEEREVMPGAPANAACKVLTTNKLVALDGLPTEATAKGPNCIWSRHLLRKAAAIKGLPMAADTGPSAPDACVHTVWQNYPTTTHQGNPRAVVLKRYFGTQSMGGTDLAETMPEVLALNQDTAVYEEGKAISAARFTRAAVDAHIRQPAWVSIGKP